VAMRTCRCRTNNCRPSRRTSSAWASRIGNHTRESYTVWLRRRYSWDSTTWPTPNACTTSNPAWPSASSNSGHDRNTVNLRAYPTPKATARRERVYSCPIYASDAFCLQYLGVLFYMMVDGPLRVLWMFNIVINAIEAIVLQRPLHFPQDSFLHQVQPSCHCPLKARYDQRQQDCHGEGGLDEG
jgi:hypothetical protein